MVTVHVLILSTITLSTSLSSSQADKCLLCGGGGGSRRDGWLSVSARPLESSATL